MKSAHMPDSDWQRVWFSIRQHPWSSLALVPSNPSMSVRKIAESLVATGRLHAERPVSLIDATGVQLQDVQQVIEAIAAVGDQGGSALVAVDPVADNPTAVAIIQSATSALMVVRLGESLLGSAQKTIDVVGRGRFIGSIVIDGSSRVSLG